MIPTRNKKANKIKEKTKKETKTEKNIIIIKYEGRENHLVLSTIEFQENTVLGSTAKQDTAITVSDWHTDIK